MPSRDLTWNLFGRDVDASRAFKNLADTVKKSTDDAGKNVDNFDKKMETLGGKFGVLATSAVTLGPALVPIGAAAVAAGGAFGLMGAAGLLAFKGISAEMKAGTPLGVQYSNTVGVLKSNLQELEHTAASGLLKPFQAAVAQIQPLMPDLNKQIGGLSSELGIIGGNVLTGLIRGFHTLEPLFQQIGADAERLSARFASYSGNGLEKFVQYAQQELPQVESTLSAVGQAVGRLVAGIAPMGGVSLTAIKLFSDTINHIPIGVLQELVPVIAGAVLAIKGFNVASAASKSLGDMFTNMQSGGAHASTTAGFVGLASKAVSGLGVAGLIAGPAIGLLSGFLDRNSAKTQAATADAQAYAQALAGASFAVDDNVRSMAAKQLQDQGALDKAKALGIQLPQLTDAITGQNNAYQQTVTQLQAIAAPYYKLIDLQTSQMGGLDDAQKAQLKQASSARDLIGILDSLSGKDADQVQKQKDLATAQQASTGTTKDQTTALWNQADALTNLTTAFQNLNDKALSLQQSELAFKDDVQRLTDGIKQNGTALDDNTASGRANQEQFLSTIQAAQAHAEALVKSGGSAVDAAKDYQTNIGALKASALQAGYTTTDVDNLIRKYGQVPAAVVTQIKAQNQDAIKKAAAAGAAIHALPIFHNTDITATDNASATLRYILGLMGGIKGADINVSAFGSLPGAYDVPGHASGGFLDPGWNRVGEQGPEMVYNAGPTNSRVMSASATTAAAQQGGGDVYITINAGLGTNPATLQNAVMTAIEQAANRGVRIKAAKALY